MDSTGHRQAANFPGWCKLRLSALPLRHCRCPSTLCGHHPQTNSQDTFSGSLAIPISTIPLISPWGSLQSCPQKGGPSSFTAHSTALQDAMTYLQGSDKFSIAVAKKAFPGFISLKIAIILYHSHNACARNPLCHDADSICCTICQKARQL